MHLRPPTGSVAAIDDVRGRASALADVKLGPDWTDQDLKLPADVRFRDAWVVYLQQTRSGWHTGRVLSPWIIQEIEEERRRREQDDRARGVRIEPPMPVEDDVEEAKPHGGGGVMIIDISPRNDNVIDL